MECKRYMLGDWPLLNQHHYLQERKSGRRVGTL